MGGVVVLLRRRDYRAMRSEYGQADSDAQRPWQRGLGPSAQRPASPSRYSSCSSSTTPVSTTPVEMWTPGTVSVIAARVRAILSST